MSLVTVRDVSLTFVGRQIYRDMGFQVESGDCIGLVGPNGSGKTTLLKLILGEISHYSGEVRVAKGTRMGYLPQDVQETLSGTLLRSVLESVPGRTPLQIEAREVEKSLENTRESEKQAKLGERLAEIHQEVNRLELEFPRHEAERIILGLGFETSDFLRPVYSLSGGWKTRAVFAGLLYQKPDLLLLDEPTNHLDIPSLRWLEQYLQEFRGAMILVSHDRDFLNRQVQRIISFEQEGARFYNGNYDFYLKAREEAKKSLEVAHQKQEQKIKEARKFIDRFRAKASKARQAQSKIKLVKKLDLVQTHKKERIVKFSFPDVPRSGREVISIRGLSKGFGEKVLYKNLNLTVLRGERVAIIGPNGCGKTTLLKMVAGEMVPDKGEVIRGHDVSMGYFAQHHSEMLDPKKTVVQEVCQQVPDQSIGFVRGVCGAFLFSGEDVEKVIGILSGGERARVSLAKLLAKPHNLMVMDEPTNHLDITSSEQLIDALEGYKGTLLFVSHNQSFINRLATKIWDISQGDIIEYPGNLDEYFYHLARTDKDIEDEFPRAHPHSGVVAEGTRSRKEPNRKARKRIRAEKRRTVSDALRPIQEELAALEENIGELESRRSDLEMGLQDPKVFSDGNRSVSLLTEYKQVQRKLDDLILKWEQRQYELESTEKRLGV
jgi:ATP-binding cassette subfamily F protein 3